ncbi:DUF3592 domain-containing protein [Marinicella sediminis]|uniref:DUF3592 domain-containing protein n=1 Tax=Marinicella sediminis TaxID=1792834 RepID=A0ABV7JEB7_9GAMM|nr:DUF3592 domain-containing protein [Marinicella sediminis]
MSFSISTGGPVWATMLMVAFLLALLFWIIRNHRLGEAAHGWHPVKATLLEVHIKTRSDDGVEESAPQIKYQYIFRGRTFTRKKLQYGDLWSTDYAESCAHVHGLHKGDVVDVLINPKKPGQSVLIPGYHGRLLPQVIGIVGLISLLLLVF